MRPKLHKTLTDYIVIGISPTLIMFLVGSLIFFLLTVFYHGNYPTRLTFIFACFVMATVLIARIAMEEGKEYASLFAFPLAIVTLLAMFRFVRIEGPLSAIGMPINIGLVALVWWSAHKLTWDCTLIDDSEDATGEGLLQTIGFDSTEVTDAPKASTAEGADDAQGAPSTDSQSGPWWRRFVERQRRPHSPGVWVVYFSLAALPLFGFGQWFISGVENRRYAFLLLCVYVASGMALLLTTSFLGLRRYLRQRRLEMPADMAGVWLAVGALMIVVLLLICSVLPRPSSEFALSKFPFRFGSPDHQQTHRNAFGNDGPQKPQGTSSRSDSQQDSSSRQSGDQTQRNGAARSGKEKGGQGQSSQKSQGDKGQGTKSKGGGREKGKSSESGKQDGGSKSNKQGQQSKQNQSEGKSSGGEGRDEHQAGKQAGQQKSPDADSKGESSDNPSQDRRKDAKQGQGERQGRGEETRENRNADKTKQDTRSENQSPSQPSASRDQRRQAAQANERQQQQQNQQQQPTPKRRSLVQLASQGIGLIFKLIFYAILLAVVVFLAWKYRDQIREVFAQWLEQLRRLWERLFGGGQVDSSEGEGDAVTRPAWRPFSSYDDPFATGRASQYSTEQLVRYSFEAMEAWARDHGCARQEDQTPLEFARQVARLDPVLANEAQVLGDLYSRIAYGRERLSRSRQAELQELWRLLKHAAPVPEAPV